MRDLGDRCGSGMCSFLVYVDRCVSLLSDIQYCNTFLRLNAGFLGFRALSARDGLMQSQAFRPSGVV